MMHALFICKPHSENGGWNDMVCLGTIAECKEFTERVADDYGGNAYGHIVDLETGRLICDMRRVKTLLGGGKNPYLPQWADCVYLDLKGIL